MKKVLLLEHDDIIALTIARYLNSKDIEVCVVSMSKNSISKYTRFCKKVFFVQNKDYLNSLMIILKNNDFDFLIPLAEPEIKLCLDNYENLAELTKVFVPPKKAFEKIEGKDKQISVAKDCGLDIPC
jgi:predicted ATP-grasp superfamily ATP-dependent carboligase